MSLQNLGENHLNSSYHTSPTIIALNFFNTSAIGEPVGLSEDKK